MCNHNPLQIPVAVNTIDCTYVVSNSEINFGDDKVGIAKRGDIFGFLISTSFLLSLGATLLSALLYSSVNILGAEGSVQFVQEFHWLCGKPLTLCLFGILFMLFSQVPSIATLYSTWVYVYSMIVGIVVIIISAFLYIKVQKAMVGIMSEKITSAQRNINTSENEQQNLINTDNDMQIGIKSA
eukprot:227525_1